ncbi:MAG: zinc ribbon domain-containing protein [Bacilli bacterium]|nr:zinc ribbon domain-containing protein [Bacilli bacterium]
MDYGYGYETGVFAAIMAVIGIVLVFALVIYVLQVIGMWKVFKKSGEEGWKAIIPIYNQYTMCKITGVNPWWVLIVVVASGLTGALGESDLASVVSLLSSIISIYFSVLLYVSLARAFGKSDGFAVGLILLNPIFLLILGCGSSKFIAKKPMHDILFDNINKNKDTQNANPVNNQQTPTDTNPSQSAAKHCTNCGAELENGAEFCKSCGSKVN